MQSISIDHPRVPMGWRDSDVRSKLSRGTHGLFIDEDDRLNLKSLRPGGISYVLHEDEQPARTSRPTRSTPYIAKPADRALLKRVLEVGYFAHGGEKCGALDRWNRCGQPFIAGFATVWNVPTSVPNTQGHHTIIRQGAFREQAAMHNVQLLVNHRNERHPLASTLNGTLRLLENDHGLVVLSHLPDSAWALAVCDAIKDRTFWGMSLTLNPDPRHTEVYELGGKVYRDVRKVTSLPEVTICSAPANESTIVLAVNHYPATNDWRSRMQYLDLVKSDYLNERN